MKHKPSRCLGCRRLIPGGSYSGARTVYVRVQVKRPSKEDLWAFESTNLKFCPKCVEAYELAANLRHRRRSKGASR